MIVDLTTPPDCDRVVIKLLANITLSAFFTIATELSEVVRAILT